MQVIAKPSQKRLSIVGGQTTFAAKFKIPIEYLSAYYYRTGSHINLCLEICSCSQTESDATRPHIGRAGTMVPYSLGMPDISGAFFWDYSGVGLLGTDGIHVLLGVYVFFIPLFLLPVAELTE